MNMTKKTYFLEIKNASNTRTDGSINIQSRFKIPYQQLGITVQGVEVLKHIVLVVTRGGNQAVVRPFKDFVVFDEDIKEDKQGCSGFFKFNLFDKISFSGDGDYYIMCSLGTTTSNIIKVTV